MPILEFLKLNILWILVAAILIMITLTVLIIICLVQNSKLKKKYKKFMSGKNAVSLEDSIMKRVSDIDHLIASNKENKRAIDRIQKNMNGTFQKVGMVKYDAFEEMGGKLSFSLCMLTKDNDGYIINAMHSREGCFTYIKEIIKGNPIIILSEEEKEALNIAKGDTDSI